MLKIRFARYGKKNHHQYKLVVIDAKKARDGKFIEILGFYKPLLQCKDIKQIIHIHIEKITMWINRGAQLSKTVQNLINKCKYTTNREFFI